MTPWVWLDYECSCLDENDPRAELLEIAMVAVEPRTLRELGAWTTPLKSRVFTGEWRPEVVEIHTASGLLAELRSGRQHLKLEAGGFPTVLEAEAQAIGFLGYYGALGQSPICGANPGFDKAWMRKHMPRLADSFHYRVFDTNFCFQLERFIRGTDDYQKRDVAHRALADCRASIQTLRNFLGGVPT